MGGIKQSLRAMGAASLFIALTMAAFLVLAAAPAFAGSTHDYMEIPNAQRMKKTQIHSEILKADVIINVPIAKHHSVATLTLAIVVHSVGSDTGSGPIMRTRSASGSMVDSTSVAR